MYKICTFFFSFLNRFFKNGQKKNVQNGFFDFKMKKKTCKNDIRLICREKAKYFKKTYVG